MTGYVELLEHSYEMQKIYDSPSQSRLGFLADSVFDLTTYDGEMSDLFGGKSLEVCKAINDRTTFDYINDRDNYVWFLTMCNFPFFASRISWGTSIRGAWWDCYPKPGFTLESCGLWKDGEQILSVAFTPAEWPEFIAAMVEFAAKE
jgi:hypothetical protein